MTTKTREPRTSAIAGLTMMVLGPWLIMGCGAATPQRLDEQVAVFLDDLRWGRMAAAEGAVGSRMRERFLRTHARWSERVHIMDMEMEAGRIGFTQGVMRVRYQWTGPDGVNIRETVVESTWRASPTTNWYLDDERVVAGDPSLLPMPRERARAAGAPASSGGSAPAAASAGSEGAPATGSVERATPSGPEVNEAPAAQPAAAVAPARAQAGAHAVTTE